MATDPELITEPHNDIAVNENLVEMRVNIPSCRKFQKIYVEVGESGKLTTVGYKAEEDAPPGWLPTLTPSKEELIPGSSMKEMLVVGLCLLDHPRQYSAYGKGPKSKAKNEEKARKGILTRLDRVSRVMVEFTKYTRPYNLNFYFAINPRFGVHQVKRITKVWSSSSTNSGRNGSGSSGLNREDLSQVICARQLPQKQRTTSVTRSFKLAARMVQNGWQPKSSRSAHSRAWVIT